jgi:hypothetical protein
MLRIGDAIHVVTDNVRPYCSAGWVSQIEVDAEDEQMVRVLWTDRLAGEFEAREPAVLWQGVAVYDREGRGEPPTWHHPDHDGSVPPVPASSGPNGGEHA